MVDISEILPPDLIAHICSFLDGSKNEFTKTCINIHNSIYNNQRNKNKLAAFYISNTLNLGYKIEIPSWFICSDNTIFTFFNNIFGDIIKGKKMVFRPPTIIEIKNTFNYENIQDVRDNSIYASSVTRDVYKKNDTKEILRCGLGSVECFFRNTEHNRYIYNSNKKRDGEDKYGNVEDKYGNEKCRLLKCRDGTICVNWSRSKDGYEKCDIRTLPNGTKYIKWEKNNDGHEKSYRQICKDGRTYENWEIDNNGCTPLITGLLQKNHDLVNRLLQPNPITGSLEVDVNHANHEGTTALHIVVENDDYESLQLILDAGTKVDIPSDERDYTLLHTAAARGNNNCLRLLANAVKDCDMLTDECETPLYIAITNSQVESVRILLTANADPNCSSDPPLLIAAEHGEVACLDLLLEAGAMVDMPGDEFQEHKTAIQYAVQFDNFKCIEVLLKAGANVNGLNTNGYVCTNGDILPIYETTPLCMAANLANPKCMKILLDAGADPNKSSVISGNKCDSPIHTILCCWNYMNSGQFNTMIEECLKLLITSGAYVDIKNKYGFTTLELATEYNWDEKYIQLIRQADLDQKEQIHVVAFYNNTVIMKRLLDDGTDPNKYDNNGNTPLHIVTENGNIACLKILIEFGANIHNKNKNGLTPLEHVQNECKNECKNECIQLLGQEYLRQKLPGENMVL